MASYIDNINACKGATFMLSRATTLQDLKYFASQVLKGFTKPSVKDLLNAELTPLQELQASIGAIKRNDLDAESWKDWFTKTRDKMIGYVEAIGSSLEALGEAAYLEAESKKSGGGATNRVKGIVYLTIGEDKVTLTDAFRTFTDEVDIAQHLLQGSNAEAMVNEFVEAHSLNAEDATALLRHFGTVLKAAEKGIRYRAERADKGEPKATVEGNTGPDTNTGRGRGK